MHPLHIVWYMCMNSANVFLKYFVNWLIQINQSFLYSLNWAIHSETF